MRPARMQEAEMQKADMRVADMQMMEQMETVRLNTGHLDSVRLHVVRSTRPVPPMEEQEGQLSASESALLLGAFVTLVASMVSFITL